MTLQLEEGKFYRTVDGRIIGPLKFSERGREWATAPGFAEDDHWYTQHNRHHSACSGRVSTDGNSSDERDNLVAEWTEADAVASIVKKCTASEEQAMKEALTQKLFGDGSDVKAEILEEAGNIVNGARRSAYGTPENNFERIARFWQAYFDNTGREVEITAADVSPMMRLMKEARLCETPDHRDSFVDVIGYALTGAEVNKVKPKKSD